MITHTLNKPRENLYWVFFDNTRTPSGERYEGARLARGTTTFSNPVPFEFTSLRAFKDAAEARVAIQNAPWHECVTEQGPKEEFGPTRSLNFERTLMFERAINRGHLFRW